jgi:hypothetical protein
LTQDLDPEMSSPSPPGRTRNYAEVTQNYELDEIVDDTDWIDYNQQDSGTLTTETSLDLALEEYENGTDNLVITVYLIRIIADEYFESRQNAIAYLHAPPSFADNTWLPFQSRSRRADMPQMRPISEYKPEFPAQTHLALSPPAFPNQDQPTERGKDPRNAHGVRLRPVSDLRTHIHSFLLAYDFLISFPMLSSL